MSETGKSKFIKESIKLRHRLEYFIFNILKRWGEGASEKSLLRGAMLLDSLLYYFLRICRKIVKINLELAFPKLSSMERKNIAREKNEELTLFWLLQISRIFWLSRKFKFPSLLTMSNTFYA